MKSNHAWDFLRRFLCLAVMLAMLVGLTACGESEAEGQGSGDSSTTQSTQSTQSTSTTSVPDPLEDPVLDLVYELTQADVDEFYRLLDECEALSIAGEDIDAVDTATAALEESYDFLDAQYTIAMIFHYSHTEDEALEKQYLDCVEICTQANDAYLQMVKRVYLSDTPIKDYLFEDWTEEDIADLMAYDEQISQLQQRNAEIGVEYRAADDDAEKITLYIEFVQNNNTIAQFYGYENYYTYAYHKAYDRDYDPAAVSQLREYAQTYLGEDVYYSALVNFYYSYYEDLSRSGQKKLESFLYDDYNTLGTDYLQLYLDSLSGSMRESISAMLAVDSFFTHAEDAKEGAFTTTIGDRSYCYFGPGYASTMTVLHEGGHYYASCFADLAELPLDLAEVHSQGNEWLFVSFLEAHMSEDQYRALVDYKLYENVAMILMCLMVDEFEQVVYTTDLTGFTAADFDAIMDEVALQYFPDGDVADMLSDMNAYWRLVVVDQPVYYISYAVSAIGAIGLYTMAEDDYDAALRAYQALCEAPVLEEGFLGNLQSAGLTSPFDEQFYEDLREIIESRS